MAPPAMQGMAQQLILDRKVGSYIVPEGWFVWAAGNRKEDRAAVFDMPAPLANRFLHLEVQADFDSFKAYALETGVHEQIIAFLSFRSTLLHKLDPQQPAWCSPRSWVMASALHQAGLKIAPAVGTGAEAEFLAFVALYQTLPDLVLILEGKGDRVAFPKEPSARYATAIGLTVRANDAAQAYNAFTWLSRVATAEWVQLFAVDLFRVMRSRGQMGALAKLVQQDAQLQKFLKDFQQLIGL
jgi:MoxR-like ATPase